VDTASKTEAHAIPWNKGKLLGQKPPLKLKEIWAIRVRLQLDHRTRELALFNLAIDSKLRGCTLAGCRDVMLRQGLMESQVQEPTAFAPERSSQPRLRLRRQGLSRLRRRDSLP
jgi:hypothetical protein